MCIRDSHRIIEGIAIAAYASGASKAYLYINAEANLSNDRMSTALEHAIGNGILGNNILQSNFNLDIEIRRGAGGYVCGEETTLINTIEGDRREPRLRPPFPTESGIMGNPTVINNPETLSSIPFILKNGPGKFKEIGTAKDSGTKIISLSGSVNRPGVIEVPMGTSIRKIIYEIGGGMHKNSELKAVAIGGPSSGLPGSASGLQRVRVGAPAVDRVFLERQSRCEDRTSARLWQWFQTGGPAEVPATEPAVHG